MGPCIIMLQHEVMVLDEWHNKGPQDLITVSLCIQNGINKIYLCSLSITYACPYHNPTAPMGHSIHNSWHQQTAHPHDAIHAVCHLPCTIGIHPYRDHLCNVPDAIECEHLPTHVSYDDQLQSGRDPNKDDEHADELPWDGFWQFVQKLFGYANRLLQQLSGWLVSDDLGGEDVGWSWAGVVTRGLRLWGRLDVLPNSLKRLWRRLTVREMNIQFTGNISGGHSCSQHDNCTLPKNKATSVALCCVIKLHILEWPFIVASLRHTSSIIMLSNQYLDMPHLWGGWIISVKEKCSLTQI